MKSKKPKRYTREEWCSRALEMLSREGQASLRIEHLAKSLGVSKGSFYWHFMNINDFVRRLAEYWARYSTSQVIDRVNQIQGDAKERLYALMDTVTRNNLGRYDLAMRAFATRKRDVARIVKKVDEERLSIIRSLFSDLGFRGPELEMRVRTFVVFHSLELGIFVRQTEEARLKMLKRRHAFFTRP